MGQMVSLTAKDGHKLGAYVAEPKGKAKGGLVVIQEIFGVNGHMKSVVDRWANEGYLAIAPAMFDRVEAGMELGYNEGDFAKGRETRGKLNDEMILNDVAAALDYAKKAGKVGIIGFCFGGYVTFISCANINGFSAGMSYYGGGCAAKKDLKSKCPMQFHFGDKDFAIPLSDVQALREAQEGQEFYVYDDAGHGFCTDDRGSYSAEACSRATNRSKAFLAKHVG